MVQWADVPLMRRLDYHGMVFPELYALVQSCNESVLLVRPLVHTR